VEESPRLGARRSILVPLCNDRGEISRSARRGVKPKGRRHANPERNFSLGCSTLISLPSQRLLQTRRLQTPQRQDPCLRPKGLANRNAVNVPPKNSPLLLIRFDALAAQFSTRIRQLRSTESARRNPSAAKTMGFTQKEFNSFKKFKSFKTS
jgi:hypothetical protein